VIIHAVGDLVTSPKVIAQFWAVSPIEFLIFWIGVIVTIFTSIEHGIYATVGASAAVMLFRIAKTRGRFLGQVPIGTLKVKDSEFAQARNVYVALDHSDGTNPDIVPIPPPKGIFIYRFSEGYATIVCSLTNSRFLYPNANRYTEHMVSEIFDQTRPDSVNPYGSLGERPWNDPGPRHKDISALETDNRPKP
jgi:solute carrier family 26 (sodium-independent sulfate anion transporter), member 11